MSEVEEKQFRSDLYYRLQAFSIKLPPLRDRRSDILPLAEYFLDRFNEKNNQKTSGFADAAVVALQQYSYPGNIRELEHIVERAAVLAGGRLITATCAGSGECLYAASSSHNSPEWHHGCVRSTCELQHRKPHPAVELWRDRAGGWIPVGKRRPGSFSAELLGHSSASTNPSADLRLSTSC
jgi:transcriptional regulator with GAF, ATPase, and Fis domain